MLQLFSRGPSRRIIGACYGAIVAQARVPCFYVGYGVPDTVEGRFDMIVLHLALLLRRLRGEPAAMRAFGQKVFDLFCTDIDHSLRELGISDLAVPRQMRRVGEAFYGRMAAYDVALTGAGDDALAATLARNVFAADRIPLGACRLAAYVRAVETSLAGQPASALVRGDLQFPDPDGILPQHADAASPVTNRERST